MSKKKLEKSESVVVDVDSSVTSVSDAANVEGQPCVELPVEPEAKRKSSATKSKKVADVALERQISDMEKALDNAKIAIESAAADNERLADELGVSVAENKSLRKELSKCKQDNKKLQGDNRANAALVEELHNQLVRKDTQISELRDTISRLQGKVKELYGEIELKDADINQCNRDLDAYAEELEKFRGMGLGKRLKFLFGKTSR